MVEAFYDERDDDDDVDELRLLLQTVATIRPIAYPPGDI
jgi:hypothetical protein